LGIVNLYSLTRAEILATDVYCTMYNVPDALCVTIGVPRILLWRGFTWWGPGQRIWGMRPRVGSRNEAPVGGLDLEKRNPPELKQNVKVLYYF